MNVKAMDHWDDAQIRAAASRERARALRNLRAHFAGWLRTTISGAAPRARTRECLDCGA
jgi:hypothetical protein